MKMICYFSIFLLSALCFIGCGKAEQNAPKVKLEKKAEVGFIPLSIDIPGRGKEELHIKPVLCQDQTYRYFVPSGFSDLDYSAYENMNVYHSENIGSVFFTTESGTIENISADKAVKEKGTALFLDENGCYDTSGKCSSIRCRGNGTFFNVEKKAFQIKFQNKRSVYGMPKAKIWLLLSNQDDTTMIRNSLALNLALAAGMQYTPHYAYADVYANGEYLGNYIVTEKVEVDPARVALHDLEEENRKANPGVNLEAAEVAVNWGEWAKQLRGFSIPNDPDDITGGYLLEQDWDYRWEIDDRAGFESWRGRCVSIRWPEHPTKKEVEYIAELYGLFEEANYSEQGINPYTGESLDTYIDMDSFAVKYLFEETIKNLDASATSQYFYKPDDSVSTKLFAGPAWDYNRCLGTSGNINGMLLEDPEGLYASEDKGIEGDVWVQLCKHEDFMKLVKDFYWNGFRENALERVEETQDISKMIRTSAIMDRMRWNTKELFMESGAPENNASEAELWDAVDGYLDRETASVQKFLKERVDFLDGIFAK